MVAMVAMFHSTKNHEKNGPTGHLLDILLLTQFHKTLTRSIAGVENLLQQVEDQIRWAIFACSTAMIDFGVSIFMGVPQ
jgi:hypothetical protein